MEGGREVPALQTPKEERQLQLHLRQREWGKGQSSYELYSLCEDYKATTVSYNRV